MRELKRQFGLVMDQEMYDALRASAERERRSLASYVRVQLERSVARDVATRKQERGRDNDG
jgi:hypothetical protein